MTETMLTSTPTATDTSTAIAHSHMTKRIRLGIDSHAVMSFLNEIEKDLMVNVTHEVPLLEYCSEVLFPMSTTKEIGDRILYFLWVICYLY